MNYRKMTKTGSKVNEEKLKKDSLLIQTAMNQGAITRKQISQKTGLPLSRIAQVFRKNEELYGEYKVNFQSIKDTAVDNLVAILDNPKHARLFEASKYILQNYKTEFDKHFSKKDDDMEILIGGRSTAAPIKIVFGKTDSDEEDVEKSDEEKPNEEEIED